MTLSKDLGSPSSSVNIENKEEKNDRLNSGSASRVRRKMS